MAYGYGFPISGPDRFRTKYEDDVTGAVLPLGFQLLGVRRGMIDVDGLTSLQVGLWAADGQPPE
jgi:hypothetical protein